MSTIGLTMNSQVSLRTPMIGRISMANRVCANGGVSLENSKLTPSKKLRCSAWGDTNSVLSLNASE
jgi:hypothetical protein